MASNVFGAQSSQDDFLRFASTAVDPVWYRARYFDLTSLSPGELVDHFLQHGLREARSPNNTFDPACYWQINSSFDANSAPAPLYHYFLNFRSHSLRPSVLFDPDWYRKELEQIGLVCDEPTLHYRRFGSQNGLSPHPLFDPDFYVKENHVELPDDLDPLSHYLIFGRDLCLQTSPNFDPHWYVAQNSDVREAGLDPLWHYLRHGFREGRPPTNSFLSKTGMQFVNEMRSAPRDPLSTIILNGAYDRSAIPSGMLYETRLGVYQDPGQLALLPQAPLVSIIIANRNGADHLSALLESIFSQSYSNFEIIFVDDGSTDGSLELVKSYRATAPSCRFEVIATGGGSGFTGANNAGQTAAKGELLVLLNNDTKVDVDWLSNMVPRLVNDPSIGCVTPKIRFWTQFIRISLLSGSEFTLDMERFEEQLIYKKTFVRSGERSSSSLKSQSQGHWDHRIELDFENSPRDLELHLGGVGRTDVSIRVNGIAVSSEKAASDSVEIAFLPGAAFAGRAFQGFYIINNAGSVATAAGMPYDRGFGERDNGQYNSQVLVDFGCGCSMMVRRDALRGKKLFIDEFLAYYEDSELSLRLRRAGYSIAYEPSALVYHKHSSTTVEGSVFWRRQTARNELLFRYLLCPDRAVIHSGYNHLRHLRAWFLSNPSSTRAEIGFAGEVEAITAEIDDIVEMIDSDKVPQSAGSRVGVFNSYWTTLGGGEAHALYVAEVLCEFGDVELISTCDFDIETLCAYFGCKEGRFRKRVVKEFTSALTAEYDILVNACFMNLTPSYARQSLYLVSFPQRRVTQMFVNSYQFLCNSAYTAKWAQTYWRAAACQIVHPMVHDRFFLCGNESAPKERIMLSVGRFASGGHVKNQMEIASAFRRFEAIRPDLGWKLVLIGSVNDGAYLTDVLDSLQGCNAEVITNASFDLVVDMYRRAGIYVHASGFGHDGQSQPELQEHFGMSVAQAAASGCIPVVFDDGGPREIVSKLGVGLRFRSVDDLVLRLGEAVELFDVAPEHGVDPVSISNRASVFGRSAFGAKVRAIASDRTQ